MYNPSDYQIHLGRPESVNTIGESINMDDFQLFSDSRYANDVQCVGLESPLSDASTPSLSSNYGLLGHLMVGSGVPTPSTLSVSDYQEQDECGQIEPSWNNLNFMEAPPGSCISLNGEAFWNECELSVGTIPSSHEILPTVNPTPSPSSTSSCIYNTDRSSAANATPSPAYTPQILLTPPATPSPTLPVLLPTSQLGKTNNNLINIPGVSFTTNPDPPVARANAQPNTTVVAVNIKPPRTKEQKKADSRKASQKYRLKKKEKELSVDEQIKQRERDLLVRQGEIQMVLQQFRNFPILDLNALRMFHKVEDNLREV